MTANPPRTVKAGLPTIRRRGRALALQVLYEVDVTGHPWRSALEHHGEQLQSSPAAVALAEQCIAGVLEHQPELDRLILRFAPAWPVSQLAVVDRNILRLALYELRVAATEPPKAIVNEAVELAKTYGGETSSRFINGVLGSVMGEERPAESKTAPSEPHP